ncbi:RICIN domain-containing protein [Streptacidiphilus sp. EB129]|uniref:RICIN domain-containing protein n=1 Tax=Streptacidiphilus sp. EB129 TaxID=3156262 RepID=UPI0035183168
MSDIRGLRPSHRAGDKSGLARGRHRRRWSATVLLLGVPAVVGPYLLLSQPRSEAATVDTTAYYRLISVHSGKALDVAGFSTADGALVDQWTDQDTANQQWQLKPTDSGFYQLVNRNSGKALDVTGAATTKGATVQQSSISGSASQQWKIGDTAGGAVTLTSRNSGELLDVRRRSRADGATVEQWPSNGGANQQWTLVKVSGTGAAPTASSSPSSSASTAASPGPYTWRNAEINGGGFVDGLVFNPSRKDLLYARTDMGGAYRWDATNKRWLPLTDWVSAKDWTLLGIESLATDPVDPDRLYLAAGTYTNDWSGNGAILRSADQGRTFQGTALPFKLGSNEDGRSMGERLAIDPNHNSTLYLGTPKNGLWRSTDYGVTWSQVASFPVTGGASSGAGISFVTFDPSGGTSSTGSDTIYVGVADSGTSLYRSTDGGTTWQTVTGEPTGQFPQHGVLSSDGSLYLTYTNALGPNGVTGGSVWKYVAKTGAWTNISPSSGNYGFAGLSVDVEHPSTVMVATLDRWWPSDEIYRSTDGGSTWKALGATSVRDDSAAPYEGTGIGNWIGSLEIDPFDSRRVLYGTGAGIWTSTDVTAADTGGSTHWTVGAHGLEETAVFGLIAPPGGASVISALGDVSGFRHDDLTKAPARAMSHPLFTTTTGIDFAQSVPAFIVRVGRGGNQNGAYSTDGGSTWTPFASAPVSGAAGGTTAVSANGTTLVWTAAGQLPYRSTDKGSTWSAVAGLPADAVVVADRWAAGTFYSLSGGTLYASTDDGKTFSARATGLGSGQLKAVPGIAQDLWIAGSTKGLLHSTDGGASFTALGTVQGANAVGFGKAAPGANYQALYLVGTVKDTFGVFRSTDEGATWVRINDDQHQFGNIDSTAVVTGDPDVYGRVYLGTNGRGVQYGDPS